MTCAHPDHAVNGRCTKEYSIARGGSEDMVLRRLKTWVAQAAHVARTRDAHRKKWEDILLLNDDNGLPTMAALDAMAPLNFDSAPAEPAAEPAAEQRVVKRRRCHKGPM